MFTQNYKFMDMTDEELVAIQRKSPFGNPSNQAATAEIERRARRKIEELQELGSKREEQMLGIAKSTRMIAIAALLVSSASLIAAFVG